MMRGAAADSRAAGLRGEGGKRDTWEGEIGSGSGGAKTGRMIAVCKNCHMRTSSASEMRTRGAQTSSLTT